MKKQNRNLTQDNQEQLIQDALRTGGFTFPQTVAEVEAFEKQFGNTDIDLPENLKVPDFIAKGKSKKDLKSRIIAMQAQENFAVAAREGATKLSDDIQKKMKMDRRKADEKYKKSKTNRK